MVLSISGLSSAVAIRLVDATKERQLESLKAEPQHGRSVSAFRDRMAGITTPKEFVADYEVYSFVMRAFDLEDQIFGKGMIRKILESDPDDETSLVNRMADPRFGELHAALGFTTSSGPQSPNFDDPNWLNSIVDRYFERVFINENEAQNETIGAVLEFRNQFGNISNWYDVLKNETLTLFFQRALGLPTELSALDVDIQKRYFEEKFDLINLSDSAERDRLIAQFVAISDAIRGSQSTTNASTILAHSPLLSGQILPITLDIPSIPFSASSIYR